MEKRQELLDVLEAPKYKGMDAVQLSQCLHMEDSGAFTELLKMLNDLEYERVIARDKRERYFKSDQLGYVQGKLRINPKGFGFVEWDETSCYINKNSLGLGMDHDVVYARTWKNHDESFEGEVIDVIEHNTTHVVGTMKVREGQLMFLPDTFMNYRKFKITNLHEFKLVNDVKVLLKIDQYGSVLKCHIEKEIGYKYDPGIDILSVLLEKNITPEFPEDVLQEVKEMKEEISEEDRKGRIDLRNHLTVTIDGEDARDLDDAISVEKLDNGLYRLYVHIADVSNYVTEKSAIDREAYERGTSVYVVDRVVPMLPHALCNGICSLNPNVERLTLTCQMDIDRKGIVQEYQIYPSIICSNERMTYTNVNKILVGDQDVQRQYPEILTMCIHMKVVAGYIRRRREGLGAIDFDSREAKILVDKKGKPTDIVLRERGEAERMIEDFMIAANETVATHVKWLETPSMYRIHETPEPKKIREFARIAKTLGYTFQGGIQNVYPAQLQSLLNEARGNENYFVLSSFMLRAMQKARYDNRCLGHFGLALKEYLHFTSPIRRYPDLIVHRMLRKYVFQETHAVDAMQNDTLWCEDAAKQASERERNAVDAEREVDSMKKAQYMERYIGDMFDGVVSGVTKFGMFVELENTIEGLVHVSTLEDDYYHYDESTKSLIGEHTATVYRMGQKVKIRCVAANRFKREIDFEVVTKRRKRKRS